MNAAMMNALKRMKEGGGAMMDAAYAGLVPPAVDPLVAKGRAALKGTNEFYESEKLKELRDESGTPDWKLSRIPGKKAQVRGEGGPEMESKLAALDAQEDEAEMDRTMDSVMGVSGGLNFKGPKKLLEKMMGKKGGEVGANALRKALGEMKAKPRVKDGVFEDDLVKKAIDHPSLAELAEESRRFVAEKAAAKDPGSARLAEVMKKSIADMSPEELGHLHEDPAFGKLSREQKHEIRTLALKQMQGGKAGTEGLKPPKLQNDGIHKTEGIGGNNYSLKPVGGGDSWHVVTPTGNNQQFASKQKALDYIKWHGDISGLDPNIIEPNVVAKKN